MAIYTIQAQIKSNAVCDKLSYKMKVYRYHNGQPQYALPLTGTTSFQSGYITQKHQSVDLKDDEAKALYILELQLYKDNGSGPQQLSGVMGTSIYCFGSSQEIQPSYVDYYETSSNTQQSSNGQINLLLNCISKKTRIFETTEHPQGDQYDPFTLEIITALIQKRLPALGGTSQSGQQSKLTLYLLKYSSDYPNQGTSSLCGAAAVFYCLQQDRPDLYRQIVLDLWNRGKTSLGDWMIKPSNGCCHPTEYFWPGGAPKVLPIDWITLASLRDTENTFTSYNSPDDEFSGITDASTIQSWFRKLGVDQLNNPVRTISSHEQKNHGYKDNYDKFSELAVFNDHIANGKHVLLLINASLLGNDCQTVTANHWIVGVKPLKLASSGIITNSMKLTVSVLDEEIEFECFSWGKIQTTADFRSNYNRNSSRSIKVSVTLKEFLSCFYNSMVFNRLL